MEKVEGAFKSDISCSLAGTKDVTRLGVSNFTGFIARAKPSGKDVSQLSMEIALQCQCVTGWWEGAGISAGGDDGSAKSQA